MVVIFTNAFVLSLYAVLAFSEHTPCTDRGGAEMSYVYERTFKFGFILLAAETFHIGVVRVYLRFLSNSQTYQRSIRELNLVGEYIEWSFRLVTFALCIFQLQMSKHKKAGTCAESDANFTIELY